MPCPEKHKSVFTTVLEWYQNHVEMAAVGLDKGMPGASERSQTSDGLESPALFRYMGMLQVDRSDLARNAPLLLRELQHVCACCPSKEKCSQDLAHKFDDAVWNKWWEYCPNSAMLAQIGAVYAATRK